MSPDQIFMPLWALVLALSSMAGITPMAADSYPHDGEVRLVTTMPSGLAGYNCAGVRAAGSTLCPIGQKADIVLGPYWDTALVMLHMLVHEIGHSLFPSGGEEAAERYACKQVPIDAFVYNFRCYADGHMETNIR